MYLSRYPRRILIDQTGEWSQPDGRSGYPGPDVVVYSVPELSHALRKYGPTGRWTISVELGLEDLAELVDYLIPIPQLDRSPIRICGGAVLLVDEVDLIAPPRSMKQEVRTLWRRSRHVGLSVVATTQRPEAVSREVSAQSQHILALHLVEPAALDYMGEIMQRDLTRGLEEWTRRHPHGGLWQEARTRRTLWLEESGALVQPVEELPVPESHASASHDAEELEDHGEEEETPPPTP